MFLKYVSYLILLVSFSNGANILAILPTPAHSHQIAYKHIWNELALRGHSVTLITTNPSKSAMLKNLTEIGLELSLSDVTKIAETELTMWNAYDIFIERNLKISEAQFSSSPVQDLIHNKAHFDVVLVEFTFAEFLAFANIYKCPKILISSLDVSFLTHQKMGNPTHPVLYPDFLTRFYGSLRFMERVETTLFTWYIYYFYMNVVTPRKQKLLHKYFNSELTMEKLLNDVDMLFVNINPVVQGSRSIGPTTINIGGYRKPIDSTPLPNDIKEFLDNAKEGFIYFSLGSNVKSKNLKDDTFKPIFEVLGEVPYKVLWKFEDDTLPGKPDNIKLIKWAPQEKILAHPNIKLFVTQGGLQSMEEAIFSAVPCVVIPFFADQTRNAKVMKSKGIAVIVDRTTLKKENLISAILEVINNPSYKNSANRLKQLALDTPMTGLEKAVWWTEYIIRNKGAKHLRNPVVDLPSYQYYLLDVIGFLIIITALILFIIVSMINILYKLFLNTFLYKKLKYKKS